MIQKTEIVPTADTTDAKKPEIVINQETMPHSPRLVIYGTNVGGGAELREMIARRLDSTGVGVDYDRDVAHVEDAFFGKNRLQGQESPSGQTALPSGEKSSKPGLLRRLSASIVRKSESVALEEVEVSTVPSGVMVFPRMRAYMDGRGMDVDTPFAEIEALCTENGVPIVYVGKNDDALAVAGQGLNTLLNRLPELTQGQ